MILFSFHLITLTFYSIQLTNAYSFRAGHCKEGDLGGKGSGHGESGSGILGQGGLSVSFDGLTLQASSVSEITSGQSYAVTLEGGPFRGFLFRLSGPNGQVVDEDILLPSNNSNNQVQTHPACSSGISAVTHKNGSDKQRVEFNFQTFDTAGTNYRLEVTVVKSRSRNNWHYQQHILTVVDGPKLTTSPSQEPTIEPSPAPSTQCFDPTLEFKISKSWQTCDVIRSNNKLCRKQKAAVTCPAICGVCNNSNFCLDSSLKFRINRNGKFSTKNCDWVSDNKEVLCGFNDLARACRKTCGLC